MKIARHFLCTCQGLVLCKKLHFHGGIVENNGRNNTNLYFFFYYGGAFSFVIIITLKNRGKSKVTKTNKWIWHWLFVQYKILPPSPLMPILNRSINNFWHLKLNFSLFTLSPLPCMYVLDKSDTNNHKKNI